MKRLTAVLAVLVFVSACGGGGGGGNTPTSPVTPTTTSPTTTPATNTPGANEIIATAENSFTPSALTVSKGTTVTFTFKGVEHNVIFASTAGAPGNIGSTSNSAVQRVFAAAGTFGYDCSLHAGMRGSVVVN